MNSNTVSQTAAIGQAKVKVERDEVFGTTVRIKGHLGPLDSVGLRLADAIAIAKFVLSLEADEADEDAYYDMLAAQEELRTDARHDATSAGWGHD